MMQELGAIANTTPTDPPDTVQTAVAVAFVQEFQGLMWPTEPLPELFEKVERAKQEWEATVDAFPELVCLVDPLGHVLRANRTVERWRLGHIRAVQGLDLHELVHGSCVDPSCALNRFFRHARQRVSQGEPTECELFDGLLHRHLQVRIRPVLMHEHVALNNHVIIIHDITERKKIEEALQRYAARTEVLNEISRATLAAGSPDAIAREALVRTRRLVPFNHAWVTLWLKPEGNAFFVLAADADGETSLRSGATVPADAFANGGGRLPDQFYAVDDLAQLDDRSNVEQELFSQGLRGYVNIPLVAEGECIGFLGLAANRQGAFRTEDLQIIQEVADLLAIATRQARLRATLERANVRLTAALEAKDQMIRNVSHELRTPLTMITAYNQMLVENELGPLLPDQFEAVETMQRHSQRLGFMVNRLLELQMFDAEGLDQMPVSLGDWIEEVAEPWITRAPQTGHTVQLRLDLPEHMPPVLVDSRFLNQVMTNLLDNALKFSPAGSTVSVRATVQGRDALVTVSDEGIGIPAEELGPIFECFYQVDGSIKRSYGGMGVGLALSRTIVEAHGGHIWAESSGPDSGSTFCFTLPLADQPYLA